ncbi:hypothetical protein [Limosilactobacillus reuteri]|uniref:hypothetical protein n=1 Tax=Limosilactobacillus reuteri TaxID=1598 RepID=UPI002B05901F|nr:hypothetical protein [Limosilactobacillus reuteri]
MLNNILSIIWIALIICIFYFWKKKPNKRYMWASIIGVIVLTFLIGSLPQNKQFNKTNDVETAASSNFTSGSNNSASSSKQSHSSSKAKKESSSKPKRNRIQIMILKHRAKGLELGTSKSTVEKKLGKPDQDNGQMLLYDDFNLYFEKGKLVGGDLPAIQKKVDKKVAKEKEQRKEEQSRLTGYAQAFGRKPVDTIQSMPSVYTSDHVEDNMVYTWHPDDSPMLVRVDSPNNFTTVYKYDKNGEHHALGTTLYQGRTIYQKQSNNNGYDY